MYVRRERWACARSANPLARSTKADSATSLNTTTSRPMARTRRWSPSTPVTPRCSTRWPRTGRGVVRDPKSGLLREGHRQDQRPVRWQVLRGQYSCGRHSHSRLTHRERGAAGACSGEWAGPVLGQPAFNTFAGAVIESMKRRSATRGGCSSRRNGLASRRRVIGSHPRHTFSPTSARSCTRWGGLRISHRTVGWREVKIRSVPKRAISLRSGLAKRLPSDAGVRLCWRQFRCIHCDR